MRQFLCDSINYCPMTSVAFVIAAYAYILVGSARFANEIINDGTKRCKEQKGDEFFYVLFLSFAKPEGATVKICADKNGN